jgi:hypothetical protein
VHQVSNISNCVKVARDFACLEGITAYANLRAEFRQKNISEPGKDDVLQFPSMLWHAWQSISLILDSCPPEDLPGSSVDTDAPTGAKRKNMLQRSSDRGKDDRARRKLQKSLKDGKITAVDVSKRIYPCPHPECQGRSKIYELGGVFSHL